MHWIRYSIFVLLLGTCGYILFQAYHFIEKHHQEQYHPVHFIPENALLVYTGNNLQQEYNKLSGGAVWFEELKSVQPFGSIMEVLMEVDSLAVDQPEIQAVFKNSRFALGLIPRQEGLSFLLCVDESENGKFFEAWKSRHPQLKSSKIENYPLLKAPNYLMLQVKDKLFIAPSEWGINLLLEEAKRKTKNWDKVFQLTDQRSSISGNFLFNFNRLADYLSQQSNIHIPKTISDKLSFSGTDFYYNSNQLFWSGLTEGKADSNFTNLPFEIHRAIPHNADLVLRYAHPHLNQYDSTKSIFRTGVDWKEYDEEYSSDFDYHLLHWMGNECAKVEIKQDSEIKRFLVFSINPNEVSPEENLSELNSRVKAYYQDMDSSNSIRLPIGWEGAFGEDFKMNETVYIQSREGYLIVANTPSDLEGYIQECQYRSLYEDVNFSLMMNRSMAKTSWAFMYINPNFAKNEIARLLKAKTENLSCLNSFPKFMLQLSKSKHRHFTNLSLSYQSEKQQNNASKLWELKLGSPAIYGPQLVKNHRTNAQDILLQTSDYVLHLISPNGNEKWSMDLEAPIIGKAEQIDGFANGKYQFLLQTQKKLHAIDILGREMEGFPIELKNPSPYLTAIRYKNGGDLRVFFASGGKLRNYDIHGKSVQGWEEPEIDYLKLPVQHFEIAGKDHLLCVDRQNVIHLWDRKGEVHENSAFIQTKIKSTVKEPVYFEKSSHLETFRLSYLDSNGVWYKRYLGGLKDSVRFINSSANSTLLISDINGDNAPEIIISGKRKLNVYWSKDDLNYSYSFRGLNVQIRTHFVSGEHLISLKTDEENSVLNEGGAPLGRMNKIPNGAFTLSDLNQPGQVVKLVIDEQGVLSAHKIRG